MSFRWPTALPSYLWSAEPHLSIPSTLHHHFLYPPPPPLRAGLHRHVVDYHGPLSILLVFPEYVLRLLEVLHHIREQGCYRVSERIHGSRCTSYKYHWEALFHYDTPLYANHPCRTHLSRSSIFHLKRHRILHNSFGKDVFSRYFRAHQFCPIHLHSSLELDAWGICRGNMVRGIYAL